MKKTQKRTECIRSGVSYKLFTMLQKNGEETVLQLNDKHLTAEMSVHVKNAENNKKQSALQQSCIFIIN
jgi:hypothetical protein